MNLSNNFTLEELTFSETAIRKGLDNTPSAEQEVNLGELANTLELVQQLLGFPLSISSAFRSPKVNAAVGGSPTSAHMDGYAADFTCKQFGTPQDICKAIIQSDIQFDQVILEGNSWVHIGVSPTMRRETLTASFAGGRATYSNGIT